MDSSLADVRSWLNFMNPSTQNMALAFNGAAKDHDKGTENFKSSNGDAADHDEERENFAFASALADVRSWTDLMNPSASTRGVMQWGGSQNTQWAASFS
jgi:hypothetical protein